MLLTLKSVDSHPLMFRGDHGLFSDMSIQGETDHPIPTHRFIFGVSPLLLQILSEIPTSKEPLLVLPDVSKRTVGHLMTFLRCGSVDAGRVEDHLALQELFQLLDIDQQSKCNETDVNIGVGGEYPENGTGIESNLIKLEQVENGDEDAEMKDADVPPPVVMYSCQQCDSCFSSSQFLNKHIKQMHKQGDLQCDQCAYCTNNKGSFKRHVNAMHKGMQNFQCDLCNTKFAQASNMERHKNATHLKLKSFVCEACGKAFPRKDQLVTHVKKIHYGEKPFCCAKCTTAFATSLELKHHEKFIHDVKG